jgi:hypothetical protein
MHSEHAQCVSGPPSPPVPVACLRRFVAVERGAVSYPSYPIHRTRPVFSSRQQVLEYEQALCLAAQVDAALEVCAEHLGRCSSSELCRVHALAAQ